MFGLYKRKSTLKRDIYFKSKGWEEPPVSLEERRTLAKKFYDQGDYETAIMLYDEIEDYDDSGFLNLMGQMFLDENSEYFDQSQATMYFRRAFLQAQTDDLKEESAQNFISSFIKEHRITPDQVHKIFVDPHIRQSVAFLGENNIEARALQFGDSVNRMFFYVASAYGGDGDLADNHEHAVGLYQAYLEAENQGYLKQTYQNLAIRYALGLGCIPDADKALNILKTAEIYFTDTTINEVLVSCLTRYVERSSNHIYAQTTNAIIEKIQINGHPWAVIPFLEDPKNYDVSAIADVSFLTAFLANAENWRFAEKWQGVAHSAARKSSTHAYMNFDFVFPTRLGAVNHINPKIREIEGNDFTLPSKRIKLHEYFRKQDLGVPPKDQEERLRLAYSFTEKVPPDYESASILFASDIDQEHSDWLLLIGFIYNDHINNPNFDAEKTFDYYTRSSKLGNSVASYNLALKYSSGEENEIDIDAAIYWFEKSKLQGNIYADYEIVRQFIDHDLRYYLDDQKDLRISLLGRIMQSCYNGSLSAMDHAARTFAGARDFDRIDSVSIKYYNYAMTTEPQYHEESIKYKMIYCYALRVYLGFGIESDKKFALSLLEMIPEKSNSIYINQTLRELSETLKGIITSEIRDPSSFSDIKWAVQNCYRHKGNPKNIDTQTTAYSVDVLWCVNQLAFGEEWPDRYQWQELLRKTQAKFMGLDYNDIYRSTLFEGPRYNPTSSNGMPVLGIWEKPSTDHKVAEKHFMDTGSYVPESGVVKFKGLHTNNEGTITFDFVKSSDQPAFLVPEDFEIALVLAFGNPEGLVQPYLSLEDPNRHGIKDKHRVFEFKEWNPHWLGYTDLGRTLYMTDQLIGRLCWTPREFDVGARNHTFDPRVTNFALNLIEDIALTGGRSGAGSYRRVMLVPEHISIQTSSNEQGHIYIDVSEVKMRIDGDYMIVGEGKDKDLYLNLNDDMYQQGRTVNKLTRRYNDVAAMMPVFTRAQELMALLHATRSLRNVLDQTGSKLNKDWHNRIMARYREFEAMPPLPRHEQLCVALPLEYKRI